MTTSLGKLRSTSLRGGKPGRGLLAVSPWRVVSGGVVPAWVPRDATGDTFPVFADFIAGRYWFNEAQYDTKENWLAAIGGTALTGPQFTFPWNTFNGTIIVEGLSSPDNSVIRNVFQIDNGNDTDISAFRVGTDQVPSTLILRASATQENLGFTPNLGPNTCFRFARSLGPNNGIASLIGRPALTDTSITLPNGPTTFRVGNRFAGDRPFTGEIWKIGVSRVASGVAQIEAFATPMRAYIGEGDSYVDGSGGSGVKISMAKTLKRYIESSAVGASTLEQEATRVEANPLRGNVPMVFWDGDANGYDASLANDMARYARIWTATNGRVCFVTPAIRTALSDAARSAYQAIGAALLSTYPNNTINSLAVANSVIMGDGINVSPSLIQADNVHPITAFCDAIVAAVTAKTF